MAKSNVVVTFFEIKIESNLMITIGFRNVAFFSFNAHFNQSPHQHVVISVVYFYRILLFPQASKLV